MMRRILWCFMFGCIAFAMSGCSTTGGSQPVVSASGPVATTATFGVAATFLRSASASFVSPANTILADDMAVNGFALVYANCSDFFMSAGQTQKWLGVSRDAIGAVGTLATGLLALHGNGQSAVSNMAFATAASFAALDIYTKNFLFAAENIESVRALISRALTVHSAEVSKAGSFTYQSATIAILDNQNICTPTQISALVKEAIKKGDVVPTTESAGGLLSISAMKDEKALQALGRILNPPTLTVDQAGALWWLLKVGPKDEAERKAIATVLKGLEGDKYPFTADNKYVANWQFQDSVNLGLNDLSEATKLKFRQNIEVAKAMEATKQVARDQGGVGTLGVQSGAGAQLMAIPKFELGVPAKSASTHVSIGIR